MKKAFRRLNVIFVIVCCLLISAILIKKEPIKYFTVIGDNVSYGTKFENNIISYGDLLYKEVSKNNLLLGFNDSFSIPNLTTGNLLEIISKDAKDNRKKSISTYIKKSKYLFVSIGINDILEKVFFDKVMQSLNYDQDSVETQLYITGQNIYQIIHELKQYNKKVKMTFLGYSTYLNNALIINLIADVNQIIKQVCIDNDVTFIEIKLNNEKFYENNTLFYPNIAGQQFISSILQQNL